MHRDRQLGNNQQTVPDWVLGAECWVCHMIGHLKRNCPNRKINPRNWVPYWQYNRGPPTRHDRGRTNYRSNYQNRQNFDPRPEQYEYQYAQPNNQMLALPAPPMQNYTPQFNRQLALPAPPVASEQNSENPAPKTGQQWSQYRQQENQ